MLFGSTTCKLTEQLRPKTGNTLAISVWLLCFLLILCLPNVSKKSYHDTVSDQFSAQQKGLLASVAWGNVVSAHGADTA